MEYQMKERKSAAMCINTRDKKICKICKAFIDMQVLLCFPSPLYGVWSIAITILLPFKNEETKKMSEDIQSKRITKDKGEPIV